MEFQHTSVLLEECLTGLAIKPDGIYVDGTLGGGGHASRVAAQLTEGGHLIGIDQDAAAIEAAGKRLAPFGDTVRIVRDNYRNMAQVLKDLAEREPAIWKDREFTSDGFPKVDGILLDLGVSSYQFDDAARGFSYREEAPLDMRMDQRRDLTAREIVNTYSEMELFRIIRDYGEDKFAKNIAKHIVAARSVAPVETTTQLSEIIKGAIPMAVRKSGGHPAKRTFQALRIACNDELKVLEDSLRMMVDLLNGGGRLCIISFHSLEDRIVKKSLKYYENPCTCPPDFPVCVCGAAPLGHNVTRKPILPTEEELEHNPRSASAKLRVFEKAGEN